MAEMMLHCIYTLYEYKLLRVAHIGVAKLYIIAYIYVYKINSVFISSSKLYVF